MSLADAFIKAGAVAEAAPEIDPTVNLPEKVEGVEVEEVADEVEQQPEVQAVTTESDDDAGNDAFREFATALGYEGEIEGNDLNALIKIAVDASAPYKEKAQILDQYPVLDDLAKHIQAGGNPAAFFAGPQETNEFQSVVIAEDDVESREAIFAHYLADRFTEDEDEDEIKEFIQGKIDKAKESGTFNQLSDKYLDTLKAREATANGKIKEARAKEYQESIEASTKFFKEVETAFASPLNGVIVDKAIITKAKEASLPKNGIVGLEEVYGKMTGAQNAIINTFVMALAEGKSFTYNPTKGGGLNLGATPVSQVLAKQAVSKQGTLNKPLTAAADIIELINKRKTN